MRVACLEQPAAGEGKGRGGGGEREREREREREEEEGGIKSKALKLFTKYCYTQTELYCSISLHSFPC